MSDSQSLASIDSQIKRSSSRNQEISFNDEEEDFSDSFIDNVSLANSWDQLSSVSRTTLSREQPRVQQVCGSQFKSNLKSLLKCKYCDEIKFSLKRVKDVNRKLRIKVQRLQENEKYQSESKKITELLFSHSGNGVDSNEVDLLRRKVEELSRTAKESKDQSESLLKQLSDYRSKYEHSLHKEQMELKSCKETLDRTTDELSLAYKSKDNLSKEKQSLEEAIIKLQELLDSASAVDTSGLKDIEELRQQIDALTIEKVDMLDEIKKLKNSISRQNNQVIQDKAEVQRLQAALRVALEEKELKTKELEESVMKLRDSKAATEQLHQALHEEKIMVKNAIVENKNLESELQKATVKNGELNKEVEGLSSKITSLNDEMAKEKEDSMKNLEKAISQSVRLVVVAPTVNVNVADEKVNVKSAISNEKLRSFLDGLLTEYSTLYRQEDSDLGPDNKTSLNQWLSVILSKMQESIEQHVHAATNGAGA